MTSSSSVSDSSPESPQRQKKPKQPKKHLPLWQETILLLGIALVLAIVLKAFFIQAFYIPSESMEPGLVDNDRILVEKPSYWAGDPERGDVVVFKDPGDWLSPADSQGPSNLLAKALIRVGLYPEGGHLVKRVIGVAGDTITCCDKQGRVSVNGEPLEESAYVKQNPGVDCNGPMVNDCSRRWRAGPIPEGQMFVMGDNRARSADSSVHLCDAAVETDCTDDSAFVRTDLVVGKVVVLLWPSQRFTFIGRPEGFADVPAAS